MKRKLGQWYMATHGVNTASKVEDMCTLLEAYWDVATKRLVIMCALCGNQPVSLELMFSSL